MSQRLFLNYRTMGAKGGSWARRRVKMDLRALLVSKRQGDRASGRQGVRAIPLVFIVTLQTNSKSYFASFQAKD